MPDRMLTAHAVSCAGFAPFGWLIDATDRAGTFINNGSSQRIDGLTQLVLDAEGGKPCLAVYKAKTQNLAGPWKQLERHRLSTQTFIPLNGVRYVVLVALGKDQPDPSTLKAFMVGGHQGITIAAGIWHHSLIALQDGSFAVLERSAAAVDCEVASLPQTLGLMLP